MMANLNFIFLFLLFLVLTQLTLNIIILPFNTYNPLIYKEEKILNLIKNAKDIDIVDTLYKNLIYTNLSISKQNQNIQTFLSMSSIEFYFKNLDMNDNIHPEEITGYSNYTYNDNYILKNIFKLKYYNSSLSKTYQFVLDIPADYYTQFSFDKGVCGNDTFFLQKKNKISDQEIIKPINLLFTYRQSVRFDHRPGVIGLQAGKNDFLLELKKSNQINNYEFTIKYNNIDEEKGKLIIGDPPHIYDENFNEKDIRNAKITQDYNYMQWSLLFSNIYIENYNYNFEKNQIGLFRIEESFTLGTNEYFELIQNIFFNKYIHEKICFLQKNKKPPYSGDYYHFLCYIENNKKREAFFKNFPSLIFFQKEMYYNFTFDAHDLFTIIPDGKRILFNIEFNNETQRWEFGKTFFKKYQLIFDLDSKLIKYYIKTNNNNNNIENINITDKILIIILLLIFVFIIGILFGKSLCNKYNRKIRANELEDNYSYTPKNLDNKNDMIEINSKDEELINTKKNEINKD